MIIISTWTLQGNWKTLEHESDGDTDCNWCSWFSHQRICTRTRGFGNNRTSGINPNYSIANIDQNTEKSPGDLRRLAVSQTPVKDHRLMLMWKTLKGVKIITMRSARIVRKVLETWGDLLSLKLQWKTISLRWYEKFEKNLKKNIW